MSEDSLREPVIPIGHTAGITSVAWSADRSLILTGSADGTAKVWNAETGKELATLAGHTGGVYGVALSSDGRFALTGSSDGTVRVWKVDTGEELFRRVHLDKADWAVVAPDGRYDGSEGALRLMYDVRGRESVPLNVQADKRYTPGLVARLFKGKTPAVVPTETRERDAERAPAKPAPPSRVVVSRFYDATPSFRTFALIVGVSEYDFLPPLVNPAPDAEAVGMTLREIYGIETALLPNPTKREFLTNLQMLASLRYETVGASLGHEVLLC